MVACGIHEAERDFSKLKKIKRVLQADNSLKEYKLLPENETKVGDRKSFHQKENALIYFYKKNLMGVLSGILLNL